MVKENSCYDRTGIRQDPPSRNGKGPSALRPEVRRLLRREAFYLWMFIAQEGLLEEAREFMEENMGHRVPFEYGPWP